MNLKDFERVVDVKIHGRGITYYENDQVIDVDQIEQGEYCATVIGSENYAVSIKINKDLDVLELECDCPYDWGTCKHEVAMMYYVREHDLFNKPIVTGPLHEIKTKLEEMEKPELIGIMLNLYKKKRLIKREIMLELGLEVDDGYEEEY